MTNAGKALFLAAVNALITLITAFGVTVTEDQTIAIYGAVNVLGGILIYLTRRFSPKWADDGDAGTGVLD